MKKSKRSKGKKLTEIRQGVRCDACNHTFEVKTNKELQALVCPKCGNGGDINGGVKVDIKPRGALDIGGILGLQKFN